MKGVAYYFVVGIMGVFAVTLMYIMFNQAWLSFETVGTSMMVNETSLSVLASISLIWTYWPIALLFAFLFLAIVVSQKRDLG